MMIMMRVVVVAMVVMMMEVTDTRGQSEPILVNGSDTIIIACIPLNNILSHRCSVDPYLFENFETSDGDFLKANIRAFKFPQSPFVLFKVVDLRHILTEYIYVFNYGVLDSDRVQLHQYFSCRAR